MTPWVSISVIHGVFLAYMSFDFVVDAEICKFAVIMRSYYDDLRSRE
jgi:hypothetical protein